MLTDFLRAYPGISALVAGTYTLVNILISILFQSIFFCLQNNIILVYIVFIGVKERCRRVHHVETLLGRRRYIENIASTDREKRMQAERKSVNTLCQGSAADLIKLAMVNIFHQLASEPSFQNIRKVKSYPGAGLYRSHDDEVRFLLQIHDELLYEVREDCVERVAAIVKSCMENAVKLTVPLQVKVEVGVSWGEMHPL